MKRENKPIIRHTAGSTKNLIIGNPGYPQNRGCIKEPFVYNRYMKKKEISKVMSHLGKLSAKKRDRSYYVKLGKKNKGKPKSRKPA